MNNARTRTLFPGDVGGGVNVEVPRPVLLTRDTDLSPCRDGVSDSDSSKSAGRSVAGSMIRRATVATDPDYLFRSLPERLRS